MYISLHGFLHSQIFFLFSFSFFFFYCCPKTVVSIFLPPLSPAPPTPISHPQTYSPLPFVHGSFIYFPWWLFPFFQPLTNSHLPSSYCQFVYIYIIDYAITVVPFFPLYSLPPSTPFSTSISPLVHVYGHISSLASPFPILFLTSPCLFCTYYLSFLFPVSFPPFSPLSLSTDNPLLWSSLWGRGPRGNNDAYSALDGLSVTYPATKKQIGPFWCWFPGGWVYVPSRTLWVSPVNCPVRLGVSPTASTPTDFYSQRFWGFISLCWNPGLCGLSHSLVVPPGLSTSNCGTSWSLSCHLDVCPFHPGCLSLPLLPVWIIVSSLIPWLWDFYTVQLSGRFGHFLF